MRVRNTSTGTVLSVDDDTGNRYVSAGWVDADKPTRSTRTESTQDDEKPKPRRRKASE